MESARICGLTPRMTQRILAPQHQHRNTSSRADSSSDLHEIISGELRFSIRVVDILVSSMREARKTSTIRRSERRIQKEETMNEVAFEISPFPPPFILFWPDYLNFEGPCLLPLPLLLIWEAPGDTMSVAEAFGII